MFENTKKVKKLKHVFECVKQMSTFNLVIKKKGSCRIFGRRLGLIWTMKLSKF